MTEYQEFTGKTVEEALRNARESFGVTGLDDLDFEILTPGSRGVLGMGAEPARIIAAPRAALGGAAPRREAAAATPLPPPPAREDRGPRDRDRDRGPRDRDRGPRDDRRSGDARPPRRDDRPAAAAPTADARPPRRDDRPRDDRPRDDRPPRRDDRRSTGTVSQREAAEVASARASLVTEREEIQAAEASPEALAAGKEILEQLVELMGFNATVTVHAGATSKIDITGADDEEREALGALIGRKGERLSALQHLVNLMLSKRMGEWTRVLVDVEDYRGRRERQLGEIARRAAERVLETGTMLQLEPMPALERRWVHLALKDIEGVSTQSIGEEPQRRIVVLPANG
jgi:spoIIIJ-associated protein